jgi:hypothetical protein
MDFLNTILAFLKSEALSIWSKVSGSFATIINEIPDDEITILYNAKTQFTTDLANGKSWGDAAADVWTYVKNAETGELGKVANLFLQAFIAKFEPPAA